MHYHELQNRNMIAFFCTYTYVFIISLIGHLVSLIFFWIGKTPTYVPTRINLNIKKVFV